MGPGSPNEAMLVAVLEAALDYAESGIPVFPCNPDNKRPLTEHGFKDASTDTAQIRSWWREHPKAMIGVPTGAASGIFVIDLDVDEKKGVDGRQTYKELCQAHGGFPITSFQVTPEVGFTSCSATRVWAFEILRESLVRASMFAVRGDTSLSLRA